MQFNISKILFLATTVLGTVWHERANLPLFGNYIQDLQIGGREDVSSLLDVYTKRELEEEHSQDTELLSLWDLYAFELSQKYTKPLYSVHKMPPRTKSYNSAMMIRHYIDKAIEPTRKEFEQYTFKTSLENWVGTDPTGDTRRIHEFATYILDVDETPELYTIRTRQEGSALLQTKPQKIRYLFQYAWDAYMYELTHLRVHGYLNE